MTSSKTPSKTPMVDAAELSRHEISDHDHGDPPFVSADLARRLERDRARLREALLEARSEYERVNGFTHVYGEDVLSTLECEDAE